MFEKSVVEKSVEEKCCRQVSEKSVVGEVLGTTFVEKC